MDIGRLLRQAAALPLRAASTGVNTTANITTATVLGGVALATVPVRSAASLVTAITDIESPARVVAEFLGGKPSRRCWRGHGRVWIEVRGLNDPQHGRELGRAVLELVRAQAGVASAVLNHPLSRLVVSTGEDGPSVRTLCDLVAAAEKQSTDARRPRPIDLPGDPMVLAGRLVALTANAAGVVAASAGLVIPLARLPLAIPAAVTVVDYQPRLRQMLENRFGSSVTDTALAVVSAAAYTVSQAQASLAVDALVHLTRAAESLSGGRAWSEHEPKLAEHAECPDAVKPARGRPPGPGPVERHADRSAVAQAIGATAIGAATRSVNAAATAAMVAAPKATRTARESFAAAIGRGLADNHRVLALRPEALRWLDRVDAVLIDPRALTLDELRVSRIRGAPEHERAAVWQWAQAKLDRGALTPGWNAAGGRWATNGDRDSAVQIFTRRAHDPLASAVVGEARRSGAQVVSLDVDDLDDLRSTFDDLLPAGDGSTDAALADALDRLQRDGHTVAVLSASGLDALSRADVAIGFMPDGAAPPWSAHLLVDDLDAAWRVLHALSAARNASRRGVEIATAASLLGALLMLPGVRGRGPGP